MISLRKYQKDLLRRVETALEPECARVMMQLPTGGGKTIIAAHLLASYLSGARKAAWLTHRTELATQTRDMLADAAGVDAWHVRRPSQAPMPSRPRGVIVVMAQTAGRRARNPDVWSEYDHDDLLIIDEAHHAAADGYERAMKSWRGRVLGMTATPWRLSLKEGFDHLFDDLICGPQTMELQRDGFLCETRVITPPRDRLIRGGEPGLSGDYTEGGIERANADSPDIMTAGALEFWQERARGRKTIIYAVSVRHAHNLATAFRAAGVPADPMLGNTPPDMRELTMRSFQSGKLTVLINVAVATEGFDLPDASCVIIARPTKSLSLYLQMVGRGMRAKDGGNDCVILDLAGNSLEHGLPNTPRAWTLSPRGTLALGEAPVVRCDRCGEMSPAARHACQLCGESFGDACQRCGKWRAWKHWGLECALVHDEVCDLCHADAHIQARLPVTDEMNELSKLRESERDAPDDEARVDEIGDDVDLDSELTALFGEILEDQRRRALSDMQDAKRNLTNLIAKSESDLKDDAVLHALFERRIANLSDDARPATVPETSRMYMKWENGLRENVQARKDELASLEARTVDDSTIAERARERVMQVWEDAMMNFRAPPNPPQNRRETVGSSNFDTARETRDFIPLSSEWTPLSELNGTPNIAYGHLCLKPPFGKEARVSSWGLLLVEVAEWISGKSGVSLDHMPLLTENGVCLMNNAPRHPNGKSFYRYKKLSNGAFVSIGSDKSEILQQCVSLLRVFGEDPSEFYVKIEKR